MSCFVKRKCLFSFSFINMIDDALFWHRNMSFSNWDQDNDRLDDTCASVRQVAWWFNHFVQSNLNALYFDDDNSGKSIHWCHLPGGEFNINYTEMNIRLLSGM